MKKLVLLFLASIIIAACGDTEITIPVSPVSSQAIHDQAVVDTVGYVTTRINTAWPDGDGLVDFNCQLRRGGANGVVAETKWRTEWGTEDLYTTWLIGDVDPGWYEVFCKTTQNGKIIYLVEDFYGNKAQDCVEGCGYIFTAHFEKVKE